MTGRRIDNINYNFKGRNNMNYITFKVSNGDKKWIAEECKENNLDVKFVETDGLIGGAEWLNVVIPLVTISIPYIAKIIMKIIDQNGPTKISCGEIVVDKVPQKDVLKVLNKIASIQDKREKNDISG